MSDPLAIQGAPIVLAMDIGGSHVKPMSSAGGDEQKAVSGPKMDAAAMIGAGFEARDDDMGWEMETSH